MNTFLKRHTHLVQWLSGLGLPLAIIISSWLISSRIESAKLDSEYVRMALGLLNKEGQNIKGKDAELSVDQIALRKWAVRLLNLRSPEKFTEAEQKAILDTDKPFGDYGETYGGADVYSDGTFKMTPIKEVKNPGRWVTKPSPSPTPQQSPK